jgi:hypothetical protein
LLQIKELSGSLSQAGRDLSFSGLLLLVPLQKLGGQQNGLMRGIKRLSLGKLFGVEVCTPFGVLFEYGPTGEAHG